MFEMNEDKIIVGLIERIKIRNGEEHSDIIARIDTGATKSSIDINLAGKLKLGPIVKTMMVKSAHGKRVRPVIHVEVEIAGKSIKTEFTVADRAYMKYPVLIGQDILKQGFLIDPNFERGKP
jgi:hypothetical protein